MENIREELIKLNKLIEIALCESLTIKVCKVIGKSFNNFFAILGSILALQFFINNTLTQQPITLYHSYINGLICIIACLLDDILYILENITRIVSL